MSKITDRELKKYYAEISAALVCQRRQKTAFLKELKSNIDEYIASTPDATMENIVSNFGTPAQIGESFLENSDYTKIKKKIDIKKYILLTLAAALLIYIAFIIISLIDVHDEAHGYFSEGILMICSKTEGWVNL